VRLSADLKKLLLSLEDPVFHSVKLSKQDITLLNQGIFQRFAMLDIAYYNHEDHMKRKGELMMMKEGEKMKEEGEMKKEGGDEVVVSVAAHYDPGILSLNVLNSQKGLQFLDDNQNWVDIPVSDSVGIIWAGDLAQKITDGRVKPGWHRVMCHKSAPLRTSIWIEACTSQQDLSMTLPGLEKITLAQAIDTQSVKFPFIMKYKGWGGPDKDIPIFESITVYPGQSLATVLTNTARLFGIPVTKAISLDYCPFCLETHQYLVVHVRQKHKDKVVFAPGAKEDWAEKKRGLF